MTIASCIEAMLLMLIGTCMLIASVAVTKSESVHKPTCRFIMTLRAYSWGDLAQDEPKEKAKVELKCPVRFFRMTRGDMEAANMFWNKTIEFRTETQPEQWLGKPRPGFKLIKQQFTHFYHKRDKQGRMVYYEALNSPRNAFKELKTHGIGVDDVVQHMTFMTEFTHRVLNDDYDEVGKEPLKTGQLIKIVDIQSLGLGDVGGDVSQYFNKIGALGKNYPERIDKILVINVPAGFGMIWKIVAPMLDRNVRERISIFRADYKAAMQELIDIENIPAIYGGTCDCGGEGCRFNSPEEVKMLDAVEKLNQGVPIKCLPCDPPSDE
eukprot:CAMPEP_0205913912 /NCGR_PEP_ID=MMETSP1325-20131115/6873_1 /ASSEMBLY_ACC=CAM_ASM_000708 /TAXON_ID=236786 /ORGANISM="Florenciella sp., Strain RCC1007" /LENGTH=322 /DNA_ID=CAMNT_0053280873 /DNA_START=17 /DNA_END=985 /DNA_ORIENTATION=-